MEEFRDHIATADKDGNRKWIYPKKPSGYYHRLRLVVSWLLLLVLFSGPLIKINGHPLFLFNILERKFIIFSKVFWPQDFILFALVFLGLLLFIILFTSLFGRLWCGWACPQTIFMEMLFRKIEYAIEGDASKQKRLDNSPWTREKFLKKISKHVIFYLISFLIANTFLAYIIGFDDLVKIVKEPLAEHVYGFFSIHIFTLVFYGVFAHFREQACVIVCPYGRYQSVIVDERTIAVTYDFERGEPRQKFSKEDKLSILNETNLSTNHGDCIDCYQCVKVCPTGIDIRNGIQMECINCTACMDECDDIMKKVKKPTGLIRYASNNMIQNNEKFKFTSRNISYSFVLVAVLFAIFIVLFNQTHTNVQILRQPGILFQIVDDKHISNMYYLKVSNKTFDPIQSELLLNDDNAVIKMIDPLDSIESQGTKEFKFFVIQEIAKVKSNISLTYSNNLNDKVETSISFVNIMKGN